MTQFIGTTGSDSATGATGVADEFVTDALQAGLDFRWNGTAWVVTGSSQGTDTLTSVETILMNDAEFALGIGGEARVNTSTATSLVPQVIGLADGGHVVVWAMSGATADPYPYGIFSQRYDAAGEPVGGETLVNTTITGSQFAPVAAALADGGYVVAWASDEIYLQRYDAAGNAVGGETLVNTTTLDTQSDPAITTLADGSFVVSWTSNNQDGDESGTYFQRFSAVGVATGAETLINTTTAGAQDNPVLTPIGNGFVATWISQGQGLVFQRFSGNGVAFGPEVVTDAGTAVSGSPVVAGTADGFLLVWSTAGGDIGAQRFATNGSELGDVFTVNTTTTSTQYQPAVAALADGGYAVSWTGYNPDTASYDIYVQRLDANGGAVGPEIVVNRTTAGTQQTPSIAPLEDGGYVVTWNHGNQVYSQKFSADGAPALPSITGDLNGNVIDAGVGTTPVRLNGGEGNDVLTGGVEDDVLDGGLGNDTLHGGAGDDLYLVDSADRVVEGTDAGIDTVQANGSFELPRNVENLTVIGSAAARLVGNRLDNVLIGNAADNVLNGRLGSDTMRGGLGDDTYIVHDLTDTAIELAGAGTDTVVSAVSFTLGANIENLRLFGTNPVDATGNALDNVITGNGGSNVLSGMGGADILAGEGGNDVYVVDALDLVLEDLDDGIDTIVASSSWVLGANLENLQLSNGGAYNATGNELANSLHGNDSANVLDGGGGADQMNGGAGNDTYFVDHADDVAAESAASTGDVVKSTVSHALGSGIEDLTLLGSGDLNGSGNSLNNTIRGTSGANILDGGYGNDRLYGGHGHDTLSGGDGIDTLYGGGGNDLYLVAFGNEDDEIVELRDQGVDTVQAEVQHSFTLGLNVENLILIGGHVHGYGNALDNEITGTVGNNLLDGGGGADRLTGSTGNDVYVVDSADDTVIEALGEGRDQVFASVTYTLAANVEHLTLTGAEAIRGFGNELRNSIMGNDARNTLNGGAGGDTLVGGGGNDRLLGEAGNDVLNGGAGNDFMDGGGDVDTASYTQAAGGVLVDLSVTAAQDTGSAGTDTLSGIENVEGSNTGGDTLSGNDSSNRLSGNGGNDILSGGAGHDTLMGDEGDDVILADRGNDTIDGGNGIDRLSFSAETGPMTVDLGLTGAQYTGRGFDTIRNIEIVEGSSTGSDTLTGDHEANTLLGLGGDDLLAGGDGADTLDGGAGDDTADYSLVFDDVHADLSMEMAINDGFGATDTLLDIENLIGGEFDDTLAGNSGANRITGGFGRDVMTGNGDNDVFVLRAQDETGTTAATRDVITDFAAGDRIDLSQIDADAATAGLQDFTEILASGTAFTQAGQLKLQNGILYGSTDGDAQAEFAIELTGVTSLTLDDFIL